MMKLIFLSLFSIALTSLSCAQRVRTGAELLLEKNLPLLLGKRVGVICNQTSIMHDGTHLVDTLLKRGVNVTALFSPEHGIRGLASAGVQIQDTADARTGLPVYSLYGKTRKPTAEMLQNVDVIVFDLQDVGARFYTYASTMAYAMQAAAENNKTFIVTDRPNPIDGIDIEGPLLDTAMRSFAGMFPIPIRHGMTIGELAKMIVGEGWMKNISGLNQTVIPMEGWKREMWYDETGLPWIAPSPNMKTLSTAIVYPGTCLIEATNISEGRGTDHPFEYIGAPWIQVDTLVSVLQQKGLEGVQFEKIQFTPEGDSNTASMIKYINQPCYGVFIRVTDRNKFKPVESGLAIITTIQMLYPGLFEIKKGSFSRLLGQADVISQSDGEKLLIGQFRKSRSKYLLY